MNIQDQSVIKKGPEASAMGVKMKFTTAEEVFKEISERIPAFKGLSYSKIGNRGALMKK